MTSVIFIVGWIYLLLKVKAKIEGVLIWFLDIPLDYLDYAFKQCLYFNKNYMESRKIVEKNIKIDECEHYITEYSPTRKDKTESGEQMDIDSSGKIRLILISRNRK